MKWSYVKDLLYIGGIIFAIVRVFINQKIITTLTTNDVKHLTDDMKKLEKESEEKDKEITKKVDGNTRDISKLYTDVGKIDERCKANHK